MKNVIYSALLLAASLAPDGETPTELLVTEEANCFIVWLCGCNEGTVALNVFRSWERNRAIEYAADRRLTPATQTDVLIKEAKA